MNQHEGESPWTCPHSTCRRFRFAVGFVLAAALSGASLAAWLS